MLHYKHPFLVFAGLVMRVSNVNRPVGVGIDSLWVPSRWSPWLRAAGILRDRTGPPGPLSLDDLNEAGIECPWQGSGEQVTPYTAADGDAFIVQCDDYSIVVVDSVDDEIAAAQKSASCQDVSTSVAQSAQAQRLIVVGITTSCSRRVRSGRRRRRPRILPNPFDGEVLPPSTSTARCVLDAMVWDEPDDSGAGGERRCDARPSPVERSRCI